MTDHLMAKDGEAGHGCVGMLLSLCKKFVIVWREYS